MQPCPLMPADTAAATLPPVKGVVLLLTPLLLLGMTEARPVVIGGVLTSPIIETKPLSDKREGLPIWFLPQLGVQTRNDPQDVWLGYGTRSLRYTEPGGWRASGFTLTAPLPAPERYGQGGSLHVALEVLRALGLMLGESPQQLDVSVPRPAAAAPELPTAQVAVQERPPEVATPEPAPPRPTPPAVAVPPVKPPVTTTPRPSSPQPSPTHPTPPQPSPAPPQVITPVAPAPPVSPARITGVRSSLAIIRNIQVQRIVIDLSGPATFSAQNERGNVTLFVPGAQVSADALTLESGDILTFTPDERGVTLRLDTHSSRTQVLVLDDPDRIVIDTAVGLDSSVPPPIKPDALPGGVSLRVLGGLSLLSFDPLRYAPRVATAPTGRALNVAELVRQAGGVAGVNGGYFDPPSSLPVDFVAAGGKLLSGSLERRGTVGFGESGQTLFGFPRPRYILSGEFGSVMVNTITARALPAGLSAFVGDGQTSVGGMGLITLTLNTAANQVIRADANGSVPATGLISLTFDPARFPQLPRTPGSPLTATLNYQMPDWQGVREGLSAGPMLLQGGQIVLNPQREAFNVLTSVWRPTRQVAYAIYRGQPTLAFLEYGTPETFARALHSAGVQDALRLDSGSSATVFVSGGYLGSGGYLNSVWSRPVPNAIVLVPVGSAAK